MAEDQPFPELGLQVFHSQHRDDLMGAEERQKFAALLQLLTHEGTQRRPADEGRMDGNADTEKRESLRQTPDTETSLHS